MIVCDASDKAIKSCSTSADALVALHERGVGLYHHPNLHAKVVAVGNTAVVGSMNASQSSASLEEAAVVTTEPQVVKDTRALVRRLASESVVIDETFIKRIRKLPVRSGGRGGSGGRGSASPIRILEFVREKPLAYVSRALDERAGSEPKRAGFELNASWGNPNESKDRARRPSDIVLWIDPAGGNDPPIEISRVLDCELVGKRWIYHEIVPAKYKLVRLSKVKQILASRGFRGDLEALGGRTQTIRLEGLEEDLRAEFGRTFPPEL